MRLAIYKILWYIVDILCITFFEGSIIIGNLISKFKTWLKQDNNKIIFIILILISITGFLLGICISKLYYLAIGGV